MVERNCEHAGCDWSTDNTVTVANFIEHKLHCQAVHAQPQQSSKAEKPKRPELASEVSDEDWNYFKTRWNQYKTATNLQGEEIISQLMECCSEQLRIRTTSGLSSLKEPWTQPRSRDSRS